MHFIAHRNYLRCRSSVPMPFALPLPLPQPLLGCGLLMCYCATIYSICITARYTRVHTHRYTSVSASVCLFQYTYLCRCCCSFVWLIPRSTPSTLKFVARLTKATAQCECLLADYTPIIKHYNISASKHAQCLCRLWYTHTDTHTQAHVYVDT